MSKVTLAPVVTCPAQLFILDRLEMPDFAGTPSDAGVYLVCLENSVRYGGVRCERVMYVGSSNNIKKRMADPTHPLNVLREQYPWPDAVYLRMYICDDYLEREVQFIKLFRPPMNIQHNG